MCGVGMFSCQGGTQGKISTSYLILALIWHRTTVSFALWAKRLKLIELPLLIIQKGSCDENLVSEWQRTFLHSKVNILLSQ